MFFVDVPSKFVGSANKYEISSSTSSSVAHKYLQVALVADENVAAKHGNHTADFLLVLANIVSSAFTVATSIFRLPYITSFDTSLRITTLGRNVFCWGWGLGRNFAVESSVKFLQIKVARRGPKLFCLQSRRVTPFFSKEKSTPRCFR